MAKSSIRFYVSDMVRTHYANVHNIKNSACAEHEENIKKLIIEVLDPIAEIFGRDIYIHSGYISKDLSEKISDVIKVTPQQMVGLSADLYCGSEELDMELYDICRQFKNTQASFSESVKFDAICGSYRKFMSVRITYKNK